MSLLKLKSRQETIKNLNSIFSALQVVAVVRTQKTKEKYFALERYLEPMRQVLRGRVKARKSKRKIVVVVASNGGLCGAFNHQAAAAADKFLSEQAGSEIVVLGENAADHLRKRGYKLALTAHEVVEKPKFIDTAKLLKNLYSPGAEITIVYNIFKSTLVQKPTVYTFSPLPPELKSKKGVEEFVLEPEPKTLIDKLFYHYLEVRLFQIILESQMGELGARFMVLKGAVDTSKELSDGLTLQINKTRQAGITSDLLEIVSATEALRKDDE
ncbi:MAG: FoF1 ATP synthase subunit gamma [bacterium]